MIIWRFLQEKEKKEIKTYWKTRVCAVSFCHDEMPLGSIKPPLASVIHNIIRHCRVRFYAFVGQPFLKQLYTINMVLSWFCWAYLIEFACVLSWHCKWIMCISVCNTSSNQPRKNVLFSSASSTLLQNNLLVNGSSPTKSQHILWYTTSQSHTWRNVSHKLSHSLHEQANLLWNNNRYMSQK